MPDPNDPTPPQTPAWFASTPPPPDPVEPASAPPPAPAPLQHSRAEPLVWDQDPSPTSLVWSDDTSDDERFRVPPGPNGEPFVWAETHGPSHGLRIAIAAGAAFIGAGIAAGVCVALLAGGGPSSAISVPGRQPVVQQGPSSTSGASSANQGIVDINTRIGYQGLSGAGTGMILTSSGEVLTNNHVIDGETRIRVTVVATGQTYNATVLGYDITGDVAVLQLQGASGLKPVVLGNSSTVKVGDHVLAVGNAGGQGGLPSQAPGTVTGLNQSITAADPAAGRTEHLTGMIETDANLQEGDSGGPLLNSSNQVVGMDTAASSGGGFGFQSAGTNGYSIPINTAITIANQIIAGNGSSTVHVGSTGFLGVDVVNSSGGTFSQGPAGALIVGIEPNTPAAGAGLQSGDTIVSLGGKSVDSQSTLSNLISGYHGGDSVSVGWVTKSGQHDSATVKLASGPPQ